MYIRLPNSEDIIHADIDLTHSRSNGGKAGVYRWISVSGWIPPSANSISD